MDGKDKKIGGRNEWREKKERKRNIIIKELNVGEREIEEKIKEIMERIEVEMKIEKIRKMEADRQERRWMVIMLESLEDKRNIIRNKWKLKGRDT